MLTCDFEITNIRLQISDYLKSKNYRVGINLKSFASELVRKGYLWWENWTEMGHCHEKSIEKKILQKNVGFDFRSTINNLCPEITDFQFRLFWSFEFYRHLPKVGKNPFPYLGKELKFISLWTNKSAHNYCYEFTLSVLLTLLGSVLFKRVKCACVCARALCTRVCWNLILFSLCFFFSFCV